MKTSIIVLLDESGSMDSSRIETIDAFNKFIKDQKRITDDTAKTTLITFNYRVKTIYSDVPLCEVKDLNKSEYKPFGATALYDAIKTSVNLASKNNQNKERVIFLIMADGEENSSKASKSEIKNMITELESSGTWTFIYIGSNPEQWVADTGNKSGNSKNFSDVVDSCSCASTAILNLRKTQQSQSSDIFESTNSNKYSNYSDISDE